MSKVNTGQASSTLIPKYIGSDFDKVVAVADNIEQVVIVGDSIEDVGTVADNINYVKEVAEDLHGMPVTMYTGENPPVLNPMPEGVMWYCTTDGRTYVWYTDADSGQWVESAPQSAMKDEATNIFLHSVPSNVNPAYRSATLYSTPAPEAEISVAHNALNTPVVQAQFIREEALWVDVSVIGAQGIVTLMGYSSGNSQLKAEIITWKNGAEGTSLGASQWVTLPSQPSVVSLPVTLANIDVLDAGDSYVVKLTSQMSAGGSAVSTILVDGNTNSRFGIIFNTNLIGLNDGIRDGVITSAPTENAVYDALQLKVGKSQLVQSGNLTSTANWANVPAYSDSELGGSGGPLNAQAKALTARSELLLTDVREALRRSYAEAGFNLVNGSFEAGGTLVNASDVLLQERTGKGFTGPAGPVDAGTDPTSGGFVDRSRVVISIGAAFGLNMAHGSAWAQGATAIDIKSWFVYAGEVWAPLSVPVTLPSAPDYANFVRLAVDGAFRPSQFGAVGDADDSVTPTDDTLAFDRGFSYCSSIGRNLIPDKGSKRYSVTRVAIPTGITRFRRFKFKARTLNDQSVYTKGPLFGGVTGIRCDVYGLDIDCNNLSRQGFVSNGHIFSDVKKLKVYNIRLAGGSAGVRVALNCNNLDITSCEITQQVDPDNGNGSGNLAGINVVAETSSVYGGIDSGGVPTYPSAITVTDINIEKNVINNGTHGVQVQGLVRGSVRKNTISGSTHRNINLSPSCQRMTIANNDLLNAGSSAVNVAWGCRNITIRGNRVSSYVVESVGNGDDAAIQAYQGASVIDISANEISGNWKYCVYTSQCQRVTIRDNKFMDGGSLANIMVETSWFQSTPPAKAACSKSRVSPVLASVDSYLIEIYGNEHGGSRAAVAISGTGGLTLAEVNVHDETIRGATRNHYIHVYSDSLALINSKISLSDIRGSLLAASSNKYFSSYGRLVFNAVKNVVGLEDDMIEQSVSGATPSAFYGPNLSVPAAATITDFIDGQNGQVINVRMSAGVTIVNDSGKIRLRGGSNISATSTNEIVTLKRIQAIWFEICRNF